MADDSRVQQLLDEIFDEDSTPEEVCSSYPELLPEVRLHWKRMTALQAELDAQFPSSGNLRDQGEVVPTLLDELPQIPGYDVESILGRGGMGVVYKARQRNLNRTVALKMLLSGAFAGEQELARFQREAEAVAGLHHANIVQVYDVGEVGGRPFFTMEFVEGGTLGQSLTGVPLPARRAAEILATLAEAMQAAHQSGIIHRDLKPGNILLTAEGTPRISDFGLARHIAADDSLTLSGARVGTPSYMAPEQAVGEPGTIGPAADNYSLGAVLYEMLTGRPPFRAENAAETERQLLTEDPVPPRRLNAAVPRDLETICMKCLHKSPQRRFTSAAALAEDLQRFQRGEPIMARPISIFERAFRWVRRRPALTAMLAFSLLLSIALIGGVLWWIAERDTEKRAAKADLQEAAKLQQQSQWPEARTALERARARLGERGSADLRRLLEQGDRDQAAAMLLDAIRLRRAESSGGVIDTQRAAAEYEAAFQEMGLGDLREDPDAVARRIEASNIQPALVTAIEDWGICTPQDSERQNWLLAVARKAMPDPTGWRGWALDRATWHNKDALRKVIEEASVTEQSVPLMISLGHCYQKLGGNAVPFFRRIQKAHPGDFWINLRLGMEYYIKKDYAEAIRYFQAAQSVRPTASVTYHNIGSALAFSNKYGEAIENYQEALRFDPTSSPTHFRLATALMDLGKYAAAVEHFRQADKLKPGGTETQFALANGLFLTGHHDEGLAYFQEALARDPTLIDLQLTLRTKFMQANRREEARLLWKAALETHPPDEASWDGYAELCLFLHREEEYRWCCRELIDRFARQADPRAAERIGRACLLLPASQDDLNRAAAVVDRTVNFAPWRVDDWLFPFFHLVHGMLAYRQGRYNDAATILSGDAANILKPAPQLVLAMAQFQLGQKDQARKTLDKALSDFDWKKVKADNREVWIYHILRREAETLIPSHDSINQPAK